MGLSRFALEPWQAGNAPKIATVLVAVDPGTTVAALTPDQMKLGRPLPAFKDAPVTGETIAPKGVVTGEDKRPMSPADRLQLVGKSRAAAENCLAAAVEFEARVEPGRGQNAGAQEVRNGGVFG